LFLIFTGVLIATVLFIVDETQRLALMSANDADIATVKNGYLEEGVTEAIELVRQRLGVTPSTRTTVDSCCYLIMVDEFGKKLAGNLPALPTRDGILEIPAPESGQAQKQDGAMSTDAPLAILGRGVELAPGIYLFVGRGTALLTATRTRILRAFLWVVAGAAAISMAGGLYLGFRTMRRVDAITDTCNAIISGRLEQRIPLTGRADQWDRLAGSINDMLNRIAALLDNLRQVSSDVAHDLRTPLTRTRNRLESARNKSTSMAEYSAAVGTAIDDMDRLLSMFAAVLRISQVEAGARMGTFSTVSLTEILATIYEIFLPVAEDYNHELTANLQVDVHIRGDQELLIQMFSNLLENAIQHTPERTRIQIVLKAEGAQVISSVSDDGAGIEPTQLDKVLRRFYKVSSSRTTAGHGLGLALVAAIAQSHQATLALTNASPGLRVTATFARDQHNRLNTA
jgi:signal transduction histidine kinase